MRLGVEAAIVEGELLRGDIAVEEGRIVSVGHAPKRGGGIAAPGFVDLQVNGFGGVDFAAADASAYRRAGEALLESGVTAYQPTLITAPEHELVAALGEVPAEPAGPRIIGVHLEGPFLSPNRLGAHPVASRRDPDRELLERLLAAVLSVTSRSRQSSPARSGSSSYFMHAASSSRAATPTRRPNRPPRPSSAVSARSRTSSTPCVHSATATRASPAPLSPART